MSRTLKEFLRGGQADLLEVGAPGCCGRLRSARGRLQVSSFKADEPRYPEPVEQRFQSESACVCGTEPAVANQLADQLIGGAPALNYGQQMVPEARLDI